MESQAFPLGDRQCSDFGKKWNVLADPRLKEFSPVSPDYEKYMLDESSERIQ